MRKHRISPKRLAVYGLLRQKGLADMLQPIMEMTVPDRAWFCQYSLAFELATLRKYTEKLFLTFGNEGLYAMSYHHASCMLSVLLYSREICGGHFASAFGEFPYHIKSIEPAQMDAFLTQNYIFNTFKYFYYAKMLAHKKSKLAEVFTHISGGGISMIGYYL